MYIKVRNTDKELCETKAFKIVNNWYVTRPLPGDLKFEKKYWFVTHKPTGKAAIVLTDFTPNDKNKLEILRKYFIKYNLGSDRYNFKEQNPEIITELKFIFDEIIYEMTLDENVDFYVSIKTNNKY